MLVRTALLHYQFETIHPFVDSNGRLGRLLIVLYLIERQVLPSPLLPLSPYFERHRSDYYRALQGVRERGDIAEWLNFFLRAVAAQSGDAVLRAERLLDLRERYRQQLVGSRSRASELVDLLMTSPIVHKRRVSTELHMSDVGAGNRLRQLTTLGILREQSYGRGRTARWYADEILVTLTD